MSAMKGAVLLLVLSGCGRTGMRSPGSFRHLGGDAGQYRPGEATPPPPEVAAPTASIPSSASGGDIAKGAAKLVGKRRLTVGGSNYRYDCSGMVCAAYATSGQTLSGSSKSLYEEAESAGLLHTRPVPHLGDIAFFDNSYDRNNNGRRDDTLTHVAVVESVDEAGTITLVHLGSGQVGRIQMNLHRPDDRAVNSYLRAPSDRDGGPRLTGELWRGFGSLWAKADRG